MRYKSTRGGGGGGSGVDYSFEQALFSGYAPDGGLFVPTSLPSLFNNESSSSSSSSSSSRRQHQFELWSQMSFAQLAYDILRKFISSTEIGNEDLQYICERSFSVDVFDDECIIPIKKVQVVDKNKSNNKSPMMYIAELFNGPTMCFKDFGMRPVIHLLSYFATKRNQPITLLVSTTGDTGPAAVHAVHELANPLLTILVHYPHGQISDFQRRQLTTLQSKYVKVVAFEGGGDDMDKPIKDTLLLSNSSNNKSNHLGRKQQHNGADDGGDEGNPVKEEGEKERIYCGINSYNIGRPLMQMIHFIWIYLRMAEELGLQLGDVESPIDLVLPTGAMGNLTGGYMAKQMGIPIGKLCCGVNINDITHRVIDRGEFHHQTIKKTLSEAINIEVPYNFERILFYLTKGDELLVRQWMETMDKTKKLTLDESWLSQLQQDFQSASITDEEMCNVLHEVYESCGYVADPHTAVAIAAAKELGYLQFDDDSNEMPTKRRRVAILATASPCKFEEAVTIALGKEAWDGWKCNFFPSRALRTMEMDDVEPFHYRWDRSRHSTLEEVQSEWRDEMMNIVTSNFDR